MLMFIQKTFFFSKSDVLRSLLTSVLFTFTVIASTPSNAGVVKVCKVAGEGVNVGDNFNFSATNEPDDNSSQNIFNVPSGAEPGGFCWIAGQYEDGFETLITEISPVGHVVTDIIVAPSNRQGGIYDLDRKQVSVVSGAGITEVTFINERRFGYIEICKEGGDRDILYEFGVYGDTEEPPVAISSAPSGACTPAIQVPVGQLIITERTAGTTIDINNGGCWTIPGSRQISCDANNSVIEVVPGDISTQTIAFILNEKTNEGLENLDPVEDSISDTNPGDLLQMSPVGASFSINYPIQLNDTDTTQMQLSCRKISNPQSAVEVCTASALEGFGDEKFISFSLNGKKIAILPVRPDGTASLALSNTSRGELSTLRAELLRDEDKIKNIE